MAAYNAEAFLAEAIDSIIAQTYAHFEFIIINDGSKDKTEQIILSYTDKRIKYIKNEINLGLIVSLNKGLENAKGDLIARMDADDVAMENRFSEQIKAFEKNPESVAIGSDYYVMSQKKLSTHTNKNDSDYLKAVLLFSPCFCHPSVMMRNIYKNSNLLYKKEYVHAEDYKLWTDLIGFGEFHNVNEPLLKYRSHSTQIGARHHAKQLEISGRIREEYLQKLGFNLTQEEIKTLHIIGNNVFINSAFTLKRIEWVLNRLLDENIRHKKFREESFKKFIHKFWMDSCGYTSLGLTAYKIYHKSSLSKLVKVQRNDRTKLLAKCVIRKFKG